MLYRAERFNKKCKNLTANKHLPMQSLANALVRDGTARFLRWKRGDPPTRHPKIPHTELTDKSKMVEISDHFHGAIQQQFECGCRFCHCVVYEHKTAMIGGHRFTAGERLRPAVRCGSIVTMLKGGRSVYGLMKRFFRVVCRCDNIMDLVFVTWFPLPTYPDRDPLTVRISIQAIQINNIPRGTIVSLNDLDGSRIGAEIDAPTQYMYMLRFDGVDTMPLD